ncbi:hypothetical protein IAD21_01482 [Abditibacteriota bacterium]|nr:hypothetical protein IAD21_01482 [Abditibacteriota bacterium]
MEVRLRNSQPDFFMPSTIGLFFIALGVFSYATRYVCAAFMCASTNSSYLYFRDAYREIGPDLTYLALLFFVTGAGFLLYSLLAQVNSTLER